MSREVPIGYRLGAGFVGALLAAGAVWMVWLLAHPDAGTEGFVRSVGRAPLPYVLTWMAGFVAGAMAAPRREDSEASRRAGPVWLAALMVFGTTLGAAAGAFAYMVFWSTSHGGDTAGALERVPEVWGDLSDPVTAFVLAGAVIGLVVAGSAAGRRVAGGVVQRFAGAVVGAIGGVILFSFAYVLRFYPQVPDSTDSVFRFAEAVYSFSAFEGLFAALGAVIGFVVSKYTWRLYGTLTLFALISMVAGYIAYTITVTLPQVPPGNLPISLVLFLAECGSLGMVLLYSFYTLDVAARKRWRREPGDADFSPYYLPRVAFQVPTFNEPPELVFGTLRSLLRMDYPEERYLIMVADDSTKEECRGPLEEFCKANGIVYLHRENRSGFKAGALNHALKYTPEDVDLLAIVDADYQVAPTYLKQTVGYFADARMGWVQTPQDYRNKDQSFLTRQYYLADSYFYRTVLPSRNEENSIIFCGTMGILRREALVDAGGWGEKYITEDAELSVRLLYNGWRSLYVNKTYGRGLIPATFEGYKKQHYRWAFGGAKIFRGHFLRIVFGRFTPRQAMDFIVGSVHWFEGVFILAIASMILFLAWGDLFSWNFVVHHDQEILLVGLVPLFLLLDGLTRLHLVLRSQMRLGLGDTLRILGMWMAVKFSNTFAAVKAFVGINMPFVRTPKEPDERIGRGQAFARAIRVTKFETTMFLLFMVTTTALAWHVWTAPAGSELRNLARGFLVIWLAYYSLVFLAAPLYAYKSYVTFRPEQEVVAPQPAPAGVAH